MLARTPPTKPVPVRRAPWPLAKSADKPGEALADPAIYKHSVVSPLRYPGAKRQLVGVLAELLQRNLQHTRLFIEPFCGGATASLRLAGTGVVDHVVLADADPLVASFWYVAAFDTSWLISAMKQEPVTVARWDWWRLSNPRSRRDMALKCLFLNRTTFSGILHGRAGPIGGRNQASAHKIDCRFGVDGLSRRIRAVGDLADAGRLLDVWHADWRSTLARIRGGVDGLTPSEVVVYCDPPYVEKAPQLYEWSFHSDEHAALAQVLRDEQAYRWILSYDDNPVARALYEPTAGRKVRALMYRYTAAGSVKRRSQSELLITNLQDLPDSLR